MFIISQQYFEKVSKWLIISVAHGYEQLIVITGHPCVCRCHSGCECRHPAGILLTPKLNRFLRNSVFIVDFEWLLWTIWRHLNGCWHHIKSRSRYRDSLVQFQVLRNYRKQYDTGILCIIIHADILRLNRTRDYIRDHSILYFQLVDQYRSAIN